MEEKEEENGRRKRKKEEERRDIERTSEMKGGKERKKGREDWGNGMIYTVLEKMSTRAR